MSRYFFDRTFEYLRSSASAPLIARPAGSGEAADEMKSEKTERCTKERIIACSDRRPGQPIRRVRAADARPGPRQESSRLSRAPPARGNGTASRRPSGERRPGQALAARQLRRGRAPRRRPRRRRRPRHGGSGGGPRAGDREDGAPRRLGPRVAASPPKLSPASSRRPPTTSGTTPDRRTWPRPAGPQSSPSSPTRISRPGDHSGEHASSPRPPWSGSRLKPSSRNWTASWTPE